MATNIRFGAACGGIVLACAIATAGSAALHPAWADGKVDGKVGGSCCTDLEERIAELEATTVRKGNRRVSLTLSGQVSRSLLYWNDGDQQDIYSVDNGLNSSRFRLTGSATLVPGYKAGFLFEMDLRIGARSLQVSQIDDDGFSGFNGILGSAALGDGIGGAGDGVIGIRQANWWVESPTLGRLTLGRLASATDGISTINLSNVTVIINSEPGEFQGAFLMRNGLGRLGSTWSQQCGGPAGNGLPTGSAGPYNSDCWEHGPSRRDAVRYDTPTIWGFVLSGSFGEDDFYDAAVRYAGEFGSFRVAAGVGYRVFRDREPDLGFPTGGPFIDKFADTNRRQWLASASIMHLPTGLFVSGAYVNYDFRGTNPNEVDASTGGHRPDIPLWWVNAGIQKNWTGWGNTTFYGEWGRFDDGTVGLLSSVAYPNLGPGATGGFLGASSVVLDSEVTWWGAGVVQTIDAAAMDFYLAYRHYEADATISGGPDNQIPGGLNGIWFIQAGARIQF